MNAPLKILFAASEVAPFSKTGGLADVTGALPPALAALGHDIRVVTPKYRSFAGEVRPLLTLERVPVAGGSVTARVGLTELPDRSGTPRVPVYAIEDDRGWFDREGIYQHQGWDFTDNLERYAFFCRAVLELIPALGWTPDLIHCHDWQTALIPVYLNAAARTNGSATSRPRTVLTIHNLGYQGAFPGERFPAIGLGWEHFTAESLEFYGALNLFKGGILAADLVTTVSPTYAQEIQSDAASHGLSGVLAARRSDLVGILNGIDTVAWDPAADPSLASSFSASAPGGKAACRTDLLHRVDLSSGRGPVVAMVTRLAEQKGIDLVIELLPELTMLDLRIVILGTGDRHYEAVLQAWSAKAPDRIAAVLRFDDALAHQVIAGADLFLMPSHYEPCGLSQQYAMRYGTVPVCHQTGGLADTVVDYRPRSILANRATGFLFKPCDADSLMRALQLALAVYRNPPAWKRLILQGMQVDFGWARSATAYVDAYRLALDPARAGLRPPDSTPS
jgi:starch synthase